MVRNFLSMVFPAGDCFNACAPEFPGCMAAGDTPTEARQRLANALEAHIKAMMLDGEPLPPVETEYGFVRVAVPESVQVTGDTMRQYRKRRGMTQSDLAVKLDVTKETVSEWERGCREIPGAIRFALEALA